MANKTLSKHEKLFFVYVLESQRKNDRRTYVGWTTDLDTNRQDIIGRIGRIGRTCKSLEERRPGYIDVADWQQAVEDGSERQSTTHPNSCGHPATRTA